MTEREIHPSHHRYPLALTQGSAREDALELIDELMQLEEETHPHDGTAVDKDEKSRLALMHVESLVKMLAGWAIDHQIGLSTRPLGSTANVGPTRSARTPRGAAAPMAATFRFGNIRTGSGATASASTPKGAHGSRSGGRSRASLDAWCRRKSSTNSLAPTHPRRRLVLEKPCRKFSKFFREAVLKPARNVARGRDR